MAPRVTVSGGPQVKASIKRFQTRALRGLNLAVARTTRAVQLDIRKDVQRTFKKSSRPANAVRSHVYDNGARGSAGLIWSKFGRGKGSNYVDFLGIRTEGGTIRPKRAGALAIPIAGKGRTHKSLLGVKRKGTFILKIRGEAYLVRDITAGLDKDARSRIRRRTNQNLEFIAKLERSVKVPRSIFVLAHLRRNGAPFVARVKGVIKGALP